MALNLVQHRGEQSVWDRPARTSWDAERWVAALAAGALLVSGFRQRSAAGLLAAIAGGALAWWAGAGVDERRLRRSRLRIAWRARNGEDYVSEASAESFPASDAPAWTSGESSSEPAH